MPVFDIFSAFLIQLFISTKIVEKSWLERQVLDQAKIVVVLSCRLDFLQNGHSVYCAIAIASHNLWHQTGTGANVLMATKNDSTDLKRHDDLIDDFFSLGEAPKKRKKKSVKKAKRDSSPEVLFEELETEERPPATSVKSPRSPSPQVATSEDSIMVLTDEDIPETKPKTRSARANRRSRKKKSPAPVDSDTSEDNADDLDLYDNIVQSISSAPRALGSTGYLFSDEHEKDRLYLLRVIPKLYSETIIDFTTKGTRVFEKILESVIQHYQTKKFFPKKLNVTDLALFWVEGKRKIEKFYKPSTLRILPPDPLELVYIGDKGHTKISCLIIPKSHTKEALNTYDELKMNSFTFEAADQDEVELEEIGKLNKFADFKPNLEEEKKEDNGGKFIIGVRGQDNKKIDIEVTSDTKIEELLWKYVDGKPMDKSGIDKSKVRLLFDDEVLDLDDLVGNTELEEEFEVQIVL